MRDILTQIVAMISGSMILSFFGLDGGKGWIHFKKIKSKNKKLKVWMIVEILIALIILSILALVSFK